MNAWLQRYTYRISITPLIFVVAAMVVLMITLMVIGFQTIKEAIANPVKSLRT